MQCTTTLVFKVRKLNWICISWKISIKHHPKTQVLTKTDAMNWLLLTNTLIIQVIKRWVGYHFPTRNISFKKSKGTIFTLIERSNLGLQQVKQNFRKAPKTNRWNESKVLRKFLYDESIKVWFSLMLWYIISSILGINEMVDA